MLWKSENERTIDTVQAVMPSVVSITLLKPLHEVEAELSKPRRGVKKSAVKIPQDKIRADGRVDVGGGSGFVVHKDGIILTNRHVISESGVSYLVTVSNGAEYEATLLAKDPMDDIAILKIEPSEPLRVAQLGDSHKVRLGQRVLAFGNALGLFRNTVSSGIISGLSRAISAREDADGPAQEMRGLIQTDAAINPGNSGGPLTDDRGMVIGINTAIVSGATNISFAIPIHAAQRDLKDLAEHGRVRRPLLGVRYLLLSKEISSKIGANSNHGALITKEHPLDVAVADNSPASVADIRENDIILTWNGTEIVPEHSIQDFLEQSEVGEKVRITILRGDETIEKTIVLAERK